MRPPPRMQSPPRLGRGHATIRRRAACAVSRSRRGKPAGNPAPLEKAGGKKIHTGLYYYMRSFPLAASQAISADISSAPGASPSSCNTAPFAMSRGGAGRVHARAGGVGRPHGLALPVLPPSIADGAG